MFKQKKNGKNSKTTVVGGWTNPSEKYARQIGGTFPNFRGENKKCLKRPPSKRFAIYLKDVASAKANRSKNFGIADWVMKPRHTGDYVGIENEKTWEDF